MKEELKQIGFSEKEAEIYLILNKIEKPTIAEIMKKTQIERRTIYDLLEKLMQKGWTSISTENKKKYYLPTSPEVILEELREKEQRFENIIPKLKELKEKNQELQVEVLRGKKGLKTVFLEVAQTKSTHYSFGNILPLLDEKYTKILDSFLNSLEGRKLKEKVIYQKGGKIRKLKGSEYREVNEKFIPPTPTLLFKDTTVQFIFTDPLTIIKIKNKDIYETNKKYFETFWKLGNEKA